MNSRYIPGCEIPRIFEASTAICCALLIEWLPPISKAQDLWGAINPVTPDFMTDSQDHFAYNKLNSIHFRPVEDKETCREGHYESVYIG